MAMLEELFNLHLFNQNFVIDKIECKLVLQLYIY